MSQTAASTPRRNIVVLSDGTGNSSAALFRTNVWRLYKALDLRDPQHQERPRQFAFYDDGVGSSPLWPLQALGGAFGFGLARNVRELYAFVCRTHMEGDHIYAFGFSRGAFTIRILCGLIVQQGLVPYTGDDAKLARDVAGAYRAYRRERFKDEGFRLAFWLRFIPDVAVWARNRAFGYESYKTVRKQAQEQKRERKPGIRFIGAFDTVSAYGLPIDELTRAVDCAIWPFSMPDHDLSPKVERAMHALSLDDERRSFFPQLWNEGPPVKGGGEAPNANGERLTQVWFAGVHSDVGGGYPDDAVSYAPLDWIMNGAAKQGLRFLNAVREDYAAAADENGIVHDSRQGVGLFYRYDPRRIERVAPSPGKKRRTVAIERIKIHESVLRRIRSGQDGYAPITPPPTFDVVKIDGDVVPATAYLSTQDASYDPCAFATAREHVYNLVWLRRVVYFVTLAVAVALAAMPVVWPAATDGACLSWLCFAAPLMTPVKAVAPSFLAPWLESFSSHPAPFSVLAAMLVAGLVAGAMLKGALKDRMRLVWASTPAMATPASADFSAPPEPSRAALFIEAVRRSRGYQKGFRVLTQSVLPAVALMAAGALSVMLLLKAAHVMSSSVGGVCASSQATKALSAGESVSVPFATSSPCQATGVALREGATYRLTFEIPEGAGWVDSSIPMGPYGPDPASWGAVRLFPGLPLRRHWTEGWFQPMARVGSIGNDTYALRPKPAIERSPDALQSSGERRFAAEIVARQDGELFLYVNDAVGSDCFYANNKGGASVTIERVGAAPPPAKPGDRS